MVRDGRYVGVRIVGTEPAVGKALIARLKVLLGGGDAMPAEFNPNPPINIGAKGPNTLKPGAFTVFHAAGFGMLWRLGGDPKHADLARQCLDKVLAGKVEKKDLEHFLQAGHIGEYAK